MSATLLYIIIGIGSALLGLGIGIYLQNLKHQSKASVWQEREQQLQQANLALEEKLRLEIDAKRHLSDEKELMGNRIVRYQADLENLEKTNQKQKEEVAQLQEKFAKDFENLANKILDEKSTKFTEQNKKNIKLILNPLQEKIQLFEKKVEQTQKENISIHSALKEQLRSLQNQNLKITQEAENLNKALK
ncbi:MAG: DNA recombination protein RmuC [Bacteroidota bacterium]